MTQTLISSHELPNIQNVSQFRHWMSQGSIDQVNNERHTTKINNTNTKWTEFQQRPTNSIDCLSPPKMQSWFLHLFLFHLLIHYKSLMCISLIRNLIFFFSVEHFNKSNCEQCKDIRWLSFVQFSFIGMHISIEWASFKATRVKIHS